MSKVDYTYDRKTSSAANSQFIKCDNRLMV